MVLDQWKYNNPWLCSLLNDKEKDIKFIYIIIPDPSLFYKQRLNFLFFKSIP